MTVREMVCVDCVDYTRLRRQTLTKLKTLTRLKTRFMPPATPIVSVGLLYCMQVQLGSGEYWREAYVRSAVPLLLHLLRQIILLHVLLHPQVCTFYLMQGVGCVLTNNGCVSLLQQVTALLASALTAVGNSKPDVVRQLLDLAVLLLREGNVDAVLKLVCEGMISCSERALITLAG